MRPPGPTAAIVLTTLMLATPARATDAPPQPTLPGQTVAPLEKSQQEMQRYELERQQRRDALDDRRRDIQHQRDTTLQPSGRMQEHREIFERQRERLLPPDPTLKDR